MPLIEDDARSVFLAALEHAAGQWPAFLDEACGGNAELRARVEQLLGAHQALGSIHGGNPGVTPPADGLVATIDDPAVTVTEVPGTMVGPYKLLEQIGEGGFGVVFMAEQTEPVRRKVALKILKPGMDTRQVVARFEAERQALAIMDHPNIARVYDGGMTGRNARGSRAEDGAPSAKTSAREPRAPREGRPYFVMELVKGVPITEFCDQHHLTPRQRLELFIPVCQAVQHAHQKGIIHRDLKPSNVLVSVHDTTPVPKVIDFGVAKALGQELTDKTLFTGFAQMIGTPLYMSPEQAGQSGLDVDTRSDVYSLGVLLYELLTGTTPFARERFKRAAYDEICRIIREEEPPKPSTRLSELSSRHTPCAEPGTRSVPTTLASISAMRQTEPAKLTRLVRGELDWIVMKALEKDRNRRYETANGFAMDVQRYLADEPVLAGPPSAAYRLKKLVRRHRGTVLAGTLVALVLVAGIIATAWQAQSALAAAAAERLANHQAQRRLAQVQKGSEVLTAIFADLDVKKVKHGTEPLEAVLAQRLVKAADDLKDEAIGDPLVVADLQNRLGLSLLHLGYPKDAIPLFVQAGNTRTAELGADHPATLGSANDLAMGYLADGNLDQAITLMQDTLKTMKVVLGVDHPDTLNSLANLAACYQAAGRLEQALPLWEEAYERMRSELGVDHRVTLSTMDNLAGCYYAADRLEWALLLWEEILWSKKVKLGPEHPDTLNGMNNVAAGYQATGKLDQALVLWKETLRLKKVKLGADHPDTLVGMHNLAVGYGRAGKWNLALPLFEETLKLRKAKLGTEHPDTLASLSNLGAAYRDTGQMDKAMPLFQEAAAGIEVRRFQHEYAALIVNHLADGYERLKQFDQAEGWRRKWLAVVKTRSGADSLAYAGALAALGLNLLLQQEWSDAEAVLRECLALRQKNAAEEWTAFDTKSMLGAALIGQKKHADAEPLALAGAAGLMQRVKTIPPRDTPRVTAALERLVRLYDDWGKPDQAAQWRKELELRTKED